MRFAPGSVTRRSALLAALAATGVAVALSAADAAETLKVGANVGNLPREFHDAKGDTVGFKINLMKEVATRQLRG